MSNRVLHKNNLIAKNDSSAVAERTAAKVVYNNHKSNIVKKILLAILIFLALMLLYTLDGVAQPTWKIKPKQLGGGTNGQLIRANSSGVGEWFNPSYPVYSDTTNTLATKSFLLSNYFKQNGNSFGANAVMGTNDNYDLVFKTNNTTRGGISKTGDWSIGTAANATGDVITRNASTGVLGVRTYAQIASDIGLGDYLPLAGGTMTGEIVMGNAPYAGSIIRRDLPSFTTGWVRTLASFTYNTTDNWDIGTFGSSANMLYGYIGFGTSSSYYGAVLKWTPDSKVGINIPFAQSPTNTFDINGDLRVRTISNGVGNVVTHDANGVLTERTPAQIISDGGGALASSLSNYVLRSTGLQSDASKTAWSTQGIQQYNNANGSTNYPYVAGQAVEFSTGIGATGSSYGRDFTLFHPYNGAKDFYLRAYNTTTGASLGFDRIWHSGDFTSTDITNWNTAYTYGQGLKVSGNGTAIHVGYAGDAFTVRNASVWASSTNRPDNTNSAVVNFTPYNAGGNTYGFSLGARNGRLYFVTEEASTFGSWIELASRDWVNAQSFATNSHTHSNKSLLDSYTQTEANLADAVAKKHDAVTLGTANGLSLSGQVLSLGLASTSTTGALSSTDWNTFNGKENALTFGTGLNRSGNAVTALNTSALWNANQLQGASLSTTTPTPNQILQYIGGEWKPTNPTWTSNTGTVTSVGLSVPTGLSITGSPITTSGTLAIGLQSGYSIPTTASQTNWNTAYGWGNHASAGYLTSETDPNAIHNQTATTQTASFKINGSGELANLTTDDIYIRNGNTIRINDVVGTWDNIIEVASGNFKLTSERNPQPLTLNQQTLTAARTMTIPDASGTVVYSVNGYSANTSGAISIPAITNLTEGSYNPGFIDISIATNTAKHGNWYWTRQGNIVTVYGSLSTELEGDGCVITRISLPVASSFTSDAQLTGNGNYKACESNVEVSGITLESDGNRAKLTFEKTGGSGTDAAIIHLNFRYEIL